MKKKQKFLWYRPPSYRTNLSASAIADREKAYLAWYKAEKGEAYTGERFMSGAPKNNGLLEATFS